MSNRTLEQMEIDTVGAAPSGIKAGQIMTAARQVFMDHGYAATSMDMIARVAGVSKATLYALYTAKEHLFALMVTETCKRQSELLDAAAVEDADLRQTLLQVGKGFLRLVLSPEALKVYRVVISETQRQPGLGRAFYDSGPRSMLGHLTAFLQRAADRGLLDLPDPQLAAVQFIGLIRNDYHMQLLLGVIEEFSDDEIDRIVEGAVRMILTAYAPKQKQAGS